MRAFTVHPSDDGDVIVEAGIRLADGRFPLPQMQPIPELLAQLGPDTLLRATTPYRRLDRETNTIDLGPELLQDVRALVLLDGRTSSSGAYFSFVHHSDTEAGVEVLLRVNAREGTEQRAQMVELVVLLPDAGVPVLVGGREAHAVVRWDGAHLKVEPAPNGIARAARPGDVRVPV
jgi:hypothetical protein